MTLSYPEKDCDSTVFDPDAEPPVTPVNVSVFASKLRSKFDDAIGDVPEHSILTGITTIPGSPGCPEPLPTKISSRLRYQAGAAPKHGLLRQIAWP